MTDSRNVEIKITGNLSEFDKAIKDAKSKLESLTKGSGKDIGSNLGSGFAASFKTAANQVDQLAQSFKSLPNVVGSAAASMNQASAAATTAGTSGEKTGLSMVNLASSLYVAEKAAQLFAAAFRAMGDFLVKAREVEDLANSFSILSGEIGRVGTDRLGDLRAATQGLTNDLDLMRSANQAVLLGVDDGTGKFEQMAAAAVKLGNAMGISTTEALNSMVIGIGRQSKLVLDNLGIIVKTEQAYDSFAASLGKTASKLTETEQKLAFQAAAFKAIEERSKNLTAVQDTAATAFERLQVAAANAYNTFSLGVSSSDDLRDALNRMGVEITSSEDLINKLGKAFGDSVAFAINFVDVMYEIVTVGGLLPAALAPIIDKVSTLTGGLRDLAAVFGAFSTGNFSIGDIGKIREQLDAEKLAGDVNVFKRSMDGLMESFNKAETQGQANGVIAQMEGLRKSLAKSFADAGSGIAPENLKMHGELLDKLREKALLLPKVLKEIGTGGEDAAKKAADAWGKLSETIDDFANIEKIDPWAAQIKEISNANKAAGGSSSDLAAKLKDLAKSIPTDQFDVFTQSLRKAAQEQSKFEQSMSELSSVFDDLNPASAEFGEYLEIANDMIAELGTSPDALRAVAETIAQIAEQAGLSADEVSRLTDELDRTQKAALSQRAGLDPLSQSLAGAFDGMTGDLGLSNEMAAFGNDIGAEIFEGVFAGIEEGFNSAEWNQLGNDVGGSVGAKLGEALGGEVGAAIGDKVGREFVDSFFKIGKNSRQSIEGISTILFGVGSGNIAGNILGHAFGGNRNPDTRARKGLQAYLNNLADSVDFDFQTLFGNKGGFQIAGGKDAFDPIIGAAGGITTRVEEELAKIQIPPELMQTFEGLGTAFAVQMGLAGDQLDVAVSQFGKLFALNFQDPAGLNTLQLMLKQAGYSAEQLGEALKTAYLKGELSAQEFLTATAANNEIMQNGIPAAIGALGLAYDNFMNGALTSGAVAQDALSDLAYEAEEVGLTFDQLQEKLISDAIAQGLDPEPIRQLFAQLRGIGIDTIEELKAINEIQTATVVSEMQKAGAAFKTAAEDIDGANEKLNIFRANAEKEVVTKWKIVTEVTGDEVPSQVNAATGGTSGLQPEGAP